jgi:hypothetical protein
MVERHQPFISFCHCCVQNKIGRIRRVKRYWEIIADNLSKAATEERLSLWSGAGSY